MTLLAGLAPDNVQAQLEFVVDAMREMSEQTDPQEMSRLYGRRMRAILPVDASLSLSRRGLDAPWYRITRSSRWQKEINPWKQKDQLPLLRGGVLGELLYAGRPRLVGDLEVPTGDPGYRRANTSTSASVPERPT